MLETKNSDFVSKNRVDSIGPVFNNNQYVPEPQVTDLSVNNFKSTNLKLKLGKRAQ